MPLIRNATNTVLTGKWISVRKFKSVTAVRIPRLDVSWVFHWGKCMVWRMIYTAYVSYNPCLDCIIGGGGAKGASGRVGLKHVWAQTKEHSQYSQCKSTPRMQFSTTNANELTRSRDRHKTAAYNWQMSAYMRAHRVNTEKIYTC